MKNLGMENLSKGTRIRLSKFPDKRWVSGQRTAIGSHDLRNVLVNVRKCDPLQSVYHVAIHFDPLF